MNPKEDALAIFKAAVDRVDPEAMIERAVSIQGAPGEESLVVRSGLEEARYELSRYDRVFAAGMGKASGAMARGLEKALGDRLAGGIVAVKEGQHTELKRIRLMRLDRKSVV